MNLHLLDVDPAHDLAADHFAAQRDTSHTLAAIRTAVELEIREAMAAGFRDPTTLVPATLLLDDGEPIRVRVEATFERVLCDAMSDGRIASLVGRAMREPGAERSRRLLRVAEAAIVDYHVAAHAPALARLRARAGGAL